VFEVHQELAKPGGGGGGRLGVGRSDSGGARKREVHDEGNETCYQYTFRGVTVGGKFGDIGEQEGGQLLITRKSHSSNS